MAYTPGVCNLYGSKCVGGWNDIASLSRPTTTVVYCYASCLMDLEGRLVYSIIHLIATSLLSSRQHYVLRLNC